MRDIPLGDIERLQARPYRALSDREYWGPHFWGLGTSSSGDAHLYLMSGRPFGARAVHLELADGEKVLVGSARPDELAAAIDRARFDDLLLTHGSPGGVALAFKVLERGLPLLGAGGPLARGEVSVRTAFGGPGARDAFELALSAVSEGRYVVEPGLARPELGFARERFVFRLDHAGRSVTLVLREGYVSDEFVALARQDERSEAEEQRLTQLKRELADRVMAEPAEAVYDVAGAGCAPCAPGWRRRASATSRRPARASSPAWRMRRGRRRPRRPAR